MTENSEKEDDKRSLLFYHFKAPLESCYTRQKIINSPTNNEIIYAEHVSWFTLYKHEYQSKNINTNLTSPNIIYLSLYSLYRSFHIFRPAENVQKV